MASPSTTPSAPIAAEVVPVAEGTPAAVLPPLGSMASLYVGDLAETVDEPQLHALFSQVAPVATVRVCRDILSGVSLGYGYVNFYSRQEATRALEALNFTPLIGKYIRNIDDGINDEGLKKLFEEFGQVASCKVMVDARGRSKGSGFVSFATAEAGQRAINRMNGRIVGKKPLYVGLAQPKEERKAMLMAHFAQRNLAMAASQYAGPQQVYFGHPSSPGPIAPPQGAVFGFPQHFVPGMGPISPVMMPPHNMQRPRYPGPAPYRQQQAMIHANANHMPNARPGPYPAMPPQAFPGAGATAWQQHAVSRTTTAVASAGPADQHQILGNKLYALVEQLERDHAGKVTGMLLEMDKAEILQLLRSPEALRAKVREAMAVLQRTKAGGSVDPAAAAAVAKAGDSAADPPPAAAAAAAAVKAGSSADPGAAAAAPTVNA
ncbi:Polyadenylate-binding protein 3 [Zea mays]|uniref:Polyadenylate-binding protein 3 n=1 Tax=Zea mays TaxID=4577 RepID=A0A1D6P2Z8_MAIZE|nr:Polyadenylate-binding protein 3 [Zea mays]